MEKKDPIEEAKRNLQKAKDILKEKAIKEDNNYMNSKYVSMAGNTAWKGCMIALEAVFEVKKTAPENKCVSIDDYKDKIAVRDKNLHMNVMNAYNILYLSMGYDGIKSYPTCKDGIDRAEQIIKWCEMNVIKQKKEKSPYDPKFVERIRKAEKEKSYKVDFPPKYILRHFLQVFLQ